MEMIRAADDMGASIIHDLTAAAIRVGKVPSNWEQSFIVCLYKGKGDAWERGNYRGLKLTEHIFVVRQLQEKYLAANKRLYMVFVDLEKAWIECLGRSSGRH